MGVCCASQNIEPNSMVDMSNIENPKPINQNKKNNVNKKEIKPNEEDNNIIKNVSSKKKESIQENNNINNKNLNKKNSTNENKTDIESKKEKIAYKQTNNDNSPVTAVKETNINSHLSDNKIMSKQNSQKKKNEEKEKEKEKNEKKKKNKNEINIVFLGDTNTGKSCFVIKFVENIFEKLYIPTLGSEIKKKIVSYNTHKYQLNFFVTSGNDYKDDYTEYYNNADFFLVFYDITNKKSFDYIKNSIQKEIMPFFFAYNDGTSNIVLVGNKIDLENERNVKIEEVEQYCKEKKFIYYEISIKTNKNINIMMNTLLKSYDQISYSE